MMQQTDDMFGLCGKIQKALILAKIAFYELFCKCNVIKMSGSFHSNGKIIKANWGDDINYWFFREIMRDRFVSYDWSLITKWLHRPYIAGIGSILTLFNMDNAIVWGSGIISATDKVIGKPKNVLAVRGPLTRKRLLEQGIDCPEVYGDPAFLLPRFYTPHVSKRYKLGIIPHYVDYNNSIFRGLQVNRDVLIIDIAHYVHWLDFVDEVCSCNVIASSSLHGLIISEAYGIPNVWIKMKDTILEDDFKYHDFFLSLGYDRDAYYVDSYVSFQDILNESSKWKSGFLDVQPLLDRCPFRLKKNVHLSR